MESSNATRMLRVVTWNARGRVHDKLPALLSLEPDVAIVCECADEVTLRRKDAARPSTADPLMNGVSMRWAGALSNTGLAVMGFGDYKLVAGPPCDQALEWVMPVRVEGPVSFNLVAIWAANHNASQFTGRGDPTYRPQAFAALELYRDFIESAPTIMAGDFNDSTRWNKPPLHLTFRDFMAAAEKQGLASAYHRRHPTTGDESGFPRSEAHSTLFHMYRPDRGYHIDYIFVPEIWWRSVEACDVGSFDDWVGSTSLTGSRLSDHAPVTLDLDIPT